MSNKSMIRLLGAIVLLVLVLVGYGFWYAAVSRESEQAGVLEAKIAEQNDIAAKSVQAKTELTLLTTQGATIDQYFVQTNDLVPFLEQIQSLGKFLGTSVQVASVSAVPGSPYGHLNLSLSISGSFDSVVRTVGALEYQPYGVSINTLTLSTSANPNASATTSPQWNATTMLTIGAQTGSTSSAATTTTSAPIPTTTTSSTTATTTLKTS